MKQELPARSTPKPEGNGKHSVGRAADGLGALLRAHRVRSALRQADLAALSAVSVRAIRDIERGRAVRPRAATVNLLADTLHLQGTERAEFEAAAIRAAVSAHWEEIAGAAGFRRPIEPAHPLFGRIPELDALDELVADPTTRLVAITGVAGIGKTRLAAEWALRAEKEGRQGRQGRQGRRSVWWADGEVRSGTVPATRRRPDAFPGDAPVLVLDGVDDHDRIRELGELMERRPDVVAVVTARLPLGVEDEKVLTLGPLDASGPVLRSAAEPAGCPAAVADAASVRLLARQMRLLEPTFVLDEANAHWLARIADLLDAHPASLIQAALWCWMRSPEAVAKDLAGGLEAISLDKPDDVLATLRTAAAGLTTAERRVVSALSRVAGAHTPPRLAEAAGIPPATLAACLPRLVLSGIVCRRPAPSGSELSVIAPVKALHGWH